MAKQRYINTKLWSDPWIRKLNPLDRYLFLYFLTNEHTNICGIYELAFETISFETGIESNGPSMGHLGNMLQRLEPKIFYIDGWVCVTNFEKHQQSRRNVHIAAGIASAKSEVPSSVLMKLQKRIDVSSMGHACPPSYSDSDLDSDSDLEKSHKNETVAARKKTKPKTPTSFNPAGAEIIKAFEVINPACKKMYGISTQRQACDDLISEYGLDRTLAAVAFVEAVRGQEYYPTITTPLQLFQKWSALVVAASRHKQKVEEWKTRITPNI